MHTTIAAGATVPPEDGDIVQAMVLAGNASGTSGRATGVQQKVGVRHEVTGVIYRSALFRSRMQVLRLGQRLARLGYADELVGQLQQREGFDAIFSRAAARRTRSSTVAEVA